MKMHSFVLLFVWRRKFLILFASLLFLVGIWAWAIFYTAAATKTTVEDDHKILSVRDFDRERGSLLQRLGFGRETDTAAGVKFVKPTGTYVDRNRDKHFKQFDSFLMDKDAKKVLQNLQMPSRDEISRRREADHLRNAAERQAHYEHELNRMGIPVIAGLGPGGHAPPAQRLVHLDLKGAPPKINYIKRILPIVKSLGATGLLLEYEDMFPFSAPITEITAKNSYNKAEIKDLLHTAASLGLTVMPLIQTFGHLEFVLKLNEFQQLREVKESPQSLCPSFNESMVFIEKMVSQIIELHTPPPSKAGNVDLDEDNEIVFPNFTHLHIGCDEVYQMGECSRCRDKAKDQLFLSHVIGVSSMIKKRWPHLKVIIWDDMLRHVQLLDLQESHIGKFVEPMVWVYAEDIYRFITSQTWDKYATVFQTAWTASAFKGAHGENLLIPPAKRHLENNLKWLAVIQSEGARFTHGIQGIALTGWQRYDHFAMLCELLPTALPSLALCLATVSKGYFDVDVKDNPILSALTCPDHSTQSMARRPWLEMNRDPNLNAFSKCMFPGSPLYRFIIRLTSVTSEAREYLVNVKQKRGWITSYNVQHNFSSPPRVENLISEAPRLTSALVSLAKNAEDTMFDIYDKWTITEFIELHILPLVVELKSFEDSGKQLMTAKTWPRRPLPYSRDLGKYDLFKVDKN